MKLKNMLPTNCKKRNPYSGFYFDIRNPVATGYKMRTHFMGLAKIKSMLKVDISVMCHKKSIFYG